MDPASILAIISTAARLIKLGHDFYSTAKDAKEDIQHFLAEVETFQNVVKRIEPSSQSYSSALPLASVSQCLERLEDVEKKLNSAKSKKRTLRSLKWPFQKSDMTQLIRDLGRYREAIQLELSNDQLSATREIEANTKRLALNTHDQKTFQQQSYLDMIPRAEGAVFNSRIARNNAKSNGPSKRTPEKEFPECLEGTRVNLLEDLDDWVESPHQSIFWLSGMAGTGKSTIARTFARRQQKQCLGASFFFSRDSEELNNADKFFTTLAIQLASVSPDLKEYICDAIMKEKDIYKLALQDQRTKLIYEPLEMLSLNPSSSKLIVVIDALDECEPRDLQEIFKFFAQIQNLKNVKMLIFVTSRPELSISDEFQDILHHKLVLQDVAQPVIENDIHIFLRHELEKVQRKHRIGDDWPTEDETRLLAQKADRLFIYAATVCRFIGRATNPPKRLSKLLGSESVPMKELDSIYTTILELSILEDSGDYDEDYGVYEDEDDHSNGDAVNLFQLIVGSIIALFNPLSVITIRELLNVSASDMHRTLYPLYSVIDIPEDENFPVRLLHLSFNDFLLSKERCSNEKFWVNQKQAHEELAKYCLQSLSTLKRNICSFDSPGTPVSDARSLVDLCLPRHVQYACRHWIMHLVEGNVRLVDDGDVHIFLKKHLLHWLEALSIMGDMSHGVIMIIELGSLLIKQQDQKLSPESSLSAFVEDARRFILENRYAIEIAPLQVYYSALIFSPRTSIIRNHFFDQILAVVKSLPSVEETWSPLLQTLQGHSGSVISVAFSPDGNQIASSSMRTGIQLWDTKTGALHRTLKGSDDAIADFKSLSFSPGGKFLLSASRMDPHHIWDLEEETLKLFENKSRDEELFLEKVVAFSPRGDLLAISYGNRIGIWNVETAQILFTLHADGLHVFWLEFAIDGLHLVSGTGTRVQVWHLNERAARYSFSGSRFTALALSRDGRTIATSTIGSDSRFHPQLWDLENLLGAGPRETLLVQPSMINALSFSFEDRFLAAAMADLTIQIWNLQSKIHRYTLDGHSGRISDMAFSPTGYLLASASEDRTVKLWDPRQATEIGLDDYTDFVSTMKFSQDGQLLATGSVDGSIRLWDPNLETAYVSLGGHQKKVGTLLISPNKRFLMSKSFDDFQIWDLETRVLLGAFSIPIDAWRMRPMFFFSTDSNTFACTQSYSEKLQLWDTQTVTQRVTINAYSSNVDALAFSPNDRILATVAHRNLLVYIWDCHTGLQVAELDYKFETKLQSGPFKIKLIFSPDSRLLACHMHPKHIYVWDVEEEKLVRRFSDVRDDTTILSFSACNSRLETNRESLDLGLSLLLSSSVAATFTPSFSISRDGQWVMWGGYKILWIPHNRRVSLANHRNIFTFNRSPRGITFLKFDSGNIKSVAEFMKPRGAEDV